MSVSDYLKCSCSHCQSPMEFPAHALGITTTCPHCGVETKLLAPAATPFARPPRSPTPPAEESPDPNVNILTPGEALSADAKSKRVLNVVLSVLAAIAVVGFIGFKLWNTFRRAANTVEVVKDTPKAEPAQPATTTSGKMPPPAPTPTSVLAATGSAPARKAGEDLQVLNFEVQKAKDGNLQYVIGVVTNHSAKQYFNVKLEFDLTRKDGKLGPPATDILRNLAPNAGVPFKTSIIGIAPVTNAKLAKLEGEKE